MWGCNWIPPFSYSMIGFLVNTLMIVTIIYIIILTFRSFMVRNKGRRDADDSMEILKNKYARGEISEDEYVRMKDILLG